MPFGITIARDVFQRQLDQCFGQIDQVIVIADDIIVVGKQHNHKDQDIALTNLLETARRCNIRLNFDKLQYKKTEVDFFGETYTTDGHKPAQSKVSAIDEMPPPTCKKQVQSSIGMVNYLSNFSVRLSELAKPIRELSVVYQSWLFFSLHHDTMLSCMHYVFILFAWVHDEGATT